MCSALFVARTGIYIVLMVKKQYIPMKAKQFNICPSCMHVATCVLTDQKNLVWSCSEYDELIVKPKSSTKIGTSQNLDYQQQINH